MADGNVLVVSKDPDFASTVAEQLLQELDLKCVVADSMEAAQPLAAAALVAVVCVPETAALACPVIAIKKVPLRMQELLDDIVALRRKQSGDDVAFGNGYVLQARQKQLVHGASERMVTLTDKEVQLLQCLCDARGKVVAKDELLKTVWGMDSGLDTHTLETHIYRLRSKFKELAGDDNMIAAMDGGYALAMK